MKIEMIKFGSNITNEIIGEKIYTELMSNIDSDEIELDFKDVKVITTFCAKQIFKRIIEKIGPEAFFAKFSFLNADDNIQYIISIGVNE